MARSTLVFSRISPSRCFVGLVLVTTFIIQSQPAHAASLPPETPTGDVPGVYYRYYEVGGNFVAALANAPVISQGVSNLAGAVVYPPTGDPPTPGNSTNSSFDLTPRNRNGEIGFHWTGFVNIPATGTWTFYTTSDDGSKLFIGPQQVEVVNNDFAQPLTERQGSIELDAGKHSITVLFKDGFGGFNIGVAWEGPGVAKQGIPNNVLTTQPPAATPSISATPPADLPTTITITDTTPGATIYYTLDGTTPDTNSIQYSAPLTLSSPATTIRAVAQSPSTALSEVASLFVDGLRAADTPAATVNGLFYRYYTNTWDPGSPTLLGGALPKCGALNSFDLLPPLTCGLAVNNIFDLSQREQNSLFGFTYQGYVSIPTDGVYTFYTNSDDGSKLFIGTREVVSNDGAHPPLEKSGKIGLKAGLHAISVLFSVGEGGAVLQVLYEGPGIGKQFIPDASFFTEPVVGQITITPNGGPFTTPPALSVTLDTPTLGAAIYYTTDGSGATEFSYAGKGPAPLTISLSDSATVRVVAAASGINPSCARADFTLTNRVPTMLSAIASGIATQINVAFDRDVEQASAENTANYTLAPAVAIMSAVRDATNLRLVRLTTGAALTTATPYTLTVQNVRDSAGANPIPPLGQSVQFQFFATGSIYHQFWHNMLVGDIAGFTANQRFPDNPNGGELRTEFEAPDLGTAYSYATRFRGYFHPSLSGDYVFAIASDDQSELYLSTDDNPANKTLIAFINTYTGMRNYTTVDGGGANQQQSAPQALVAGQRYYIESLHIGISSPNGLSVIARRTVDAPIANGDPPIQGAELSPYIESLTVLTSPGNKTVERGEAVTFNVSAAGSGPRTYQWQKNGVDIVGATQEFYTIPAAAFADAGNYRVIISNASGSATSAAATLTVIDTIAPRLVLVRPIDTTHVEAVFSEPVDGGSGGNAANYAIDQGVSVTAAAVSGQTVTLTTSALCANTLYTLTVNNVMDTGAPANTIAANSQRTFTLTEDLTLGLVAYYKLDETGTTASAADSSGNAHTGTLQNFQFDASSGWSAGQIAGGLKADGTNDRVTVADRYDLRFPATEGFTLSAWVNVPSLPGAVAGIVTKSRDAAPGYGILISAANNWVFAGPTDMTGSAVTTGWHQVTAIQNGVTNTRALFVDGVSVATGAAQNGNGPGLLLLGAGVNESFSGTLDDVRLYNRALSSAEIQLLVNYRGNRAPVVSAGPDQSISSSSATLAGNISDDGLPNPPAAFTQTWSKASGPGTVSFSPSANVLAPTAMFSAPGTYLLHLVGDDSQFIGCDDVTITVNATPPSVTINQAGAQGDPTNASPINFTVVFSEPVTGFATGDVTLSGTAGATTGTVTEIAPNDGTTYNVAVSGMTNDGTVIVSVLAGRAQDADTNGNTASTSTDNIVTYDTTGPTVTIDQAIAQADPTNASPINFMVVFSESVANFATGDVTLSGTAGATTGTISEIAPNNGTTYNVAVSGMPGEGTVIATILAGVAQDTAGNANAASTSTDNTVTFDATAPSVTINQAVAQADPASASPINFTVVFSESVTGFTTGDLMLSGTAGATTATVTGSGATYNVAVSGMTGNGTAIVSIMAGVAQDAAANGNAASTSTDNSVTFDATAPSVTINQDAAQADPASASQINFAVLFSEPVTGFATGDVTLSDTAGATTATVTGSSATYNVAVSGMTGNGTAIVSIMAGVAQDAAGNANTASTSTDNSVTYDAPAPTVTSITPKSGPIAGGSAVTITGTNFAAGATVTIGGVAAGNVSVVSATQITATTPAHAAGTLDVVVTNVDSQSATLSGGFIAFDPGLAPTVSGIAPNAGSTAGATAVTITGTNFFSGAAVTLGGTVATNITVVSATQITATTPAHAVGAVDVVVTNPDTQAASLAGGYTFVAPPVITSAASASGKLGSAFSYSITATNSPSSFGATGLPAGLSVDTATGAISGTPSVVGKTDATISATNAGGTGSATLNITISPSGPPSISSVSSSQNPAKTNTSVSFTASAGHPDNLALTFTWDFGDGSALVGGSGAQVAHAFGTEANFTVKVTASDGFNAVSSSINQSIFAPASGGTQGDNVGTGSSSSNVYTDIEIKVLSSEGGVVEFQVLKGGQPVPPGYIVTTVIADANGPLATITGDKPVYKFTAPGIYTATATVKDSADQLAGETRLTLPVSSAETGGGGGGGEPGTTPPASKEVTVLGVGGKFYFRDNKPDLIQFKGAIELPAGLVLAKDRLWWCSAGNVTDSVMVDVKGRGKTPGAQNRITKMRVKFPRLKKGLTATFAGQRASVQFTLSVPNLDDLGFATEGIRPVLAPGEENQKSVKRFIQVAMLFAGYAYQGKAPVEFKLSRDRSTGTILPGRTGEGSRPQTILPR